MMVRVKAFWILIKSPGSLRFGKFKNPFNNRKAAENYVRWLRNNGYPRSKFKIVHEKRKLAKDAKVFETSKRARKG